MAAGVPDGSSEQPHEGGTTLSGAQISAINRFPDDNPNPVLRVDDDGHVIYANPASAAVLKALGVAVGDRVPPETMARLAAVGVERGSLELLVDHRTYEVWPVPVPDLHFTNLYGRDVTAERAIVKFPDQNPNPVFRIHRDGRLLYANPASLGLIAGLGLAVGDDLPVGLRDALVERASSADGAMTAEVEADGCTYALLPVDAYMVVGGMSPGSVDHTFRVAAMALELTKAVSRMDTAVRLGIRFRIGIHCGPVIAGVIGTKKFIYDIWGDTVNMASRMESLSVPGRIQVTQAVKERLDGRYVLEPRGLVNVKGKGLTPTWFIVGPIQSTRRGRHSAAVGTQRP